MADRIIRSRFPSRGKRRETEWFASADAVALTTLAAATFTLDQSLTAAELAKRPFTVVRTVGSIWVKSDQKAANESPFGAMGFLVASEKAVALGVTALPDPITQEASDSWFVYQQVAASGGPEEGRPFDRYDFNSKAMRKVQDGEDIAVMVTNASSTLGLQFVIKFRLLIKVA